MYDKDKNGLIDPFEASPMMQDTYLNMNRTITPTKYDLESYQKVLDQNGDGRVTLGDFESLIIKYFCGARDTTRLGSQDPRYIEKTTTTIIRTEPLKRSVYAEEPPKKAAQEDSYNKGFVYRQLEQARRIFRKYDRDNSGFIDEDELIPMLEDTYRAIGAERVITKEDVSSYLGMIDSNRDGKISIVEFETIVIKALERVGISFDT
jgi:Ca2+-binding EF-hand superfamily protein